MVVERERKMSIKRMACFALNAMVFCTNGGRRSDWSPLKPNWLFAIAGPHRSPLASVKLRCTLRGLNVVGFGWRIDSSGSRYTSLQCCSLPDSHWSGKSWPISSVGALKSVDSFFLPCDWCAQDWHDELALL